MRGLALCLVAWGCGGDGGSTHDSGDTGLAACAEAPPTTWENFGAGFVTENCQVCHASEAAERHGAPPRSVFDTEDDALEQADAILERVVERGDMPPQGGLTDDDRALVEYWLRCGS